MRKIVISILIILFFSVSSAYAKILSIDTSLKNTTEKASFIVVGKVTEIIPFGLNKLALIKVEKILKGKLETEGIKVFFYGPKVGGDKTDVDSELRILQFTKGEKCIIFLYKKESLDRYYYVVNHDHGKLKILETKEGKFVKVPFFFKRNDKLNEIEPLEKIINLIKQQPSNFSSNER